MTLAPLRSHFALLNIVLSNAVKVPSPIATISHRTSNNPPIKIIRPPRNSHYASNFTIKNSTRTELSFANTMTKRTVSEEGRVYSKRFLRWKIIKVSLVGRGKREGERGGAAWWGLLSVAVAVAVSVGLISS